MKAKTVKTGKARVLTSSECLRILLEKEEEKKKVAQEKERRKQERELKKKQKEEEQKRKAEEKVRKAAEREAAKALKEAAKADREAAKLAEREKKELQKSQKSGQKRQACPVATTTRPKRNKLKENVDVSINADLCCVCFGSYQEDVGTGREWLQSSCSRWIVWTMRMWKKTVEGCVPCVRIQSQYCVHLLHINVIIAKQKLLHKKSIFSTGKG